MDASGVAGQEENLRDVLAASARVTFTLVARASGRFTAAYPVTVGSIDCSPVEVGLKID